MRIHNVYSDLLLGLSRFINNKVLHGRPIEHFQLNIGDSGLQLDYEQGYSLPAGIINLESIRPFNNHPYIFQHRSGNKHNIPVLYDNDKDMLLKVQEEQFNLDVNLLINSANHMQALDIQHQLLSYIPVAKYMHFYELVTFLEIDDFLINKWLFDIENDSIDNLYLKQNKYTDTLDYSFSLLMQPLLRFNDFTIQMSPDTNQETFQVSSSIEYLIAIPVYLHYPGFNIHSELGPELINIVRKNIVVPATDRDYGRVTISSIEPNDHFFKTITVPIYFGDYEDFKFSSHMEFIGKDNELVIGELSGSFLEEITEFDFESVVDNNIIIGSGNTLYNYSDTTITGTLSGHIISGNISDIKLIREGSFSCWFEGILSGRHIGKEIIIQYIEKNKIRKLRDIKTKFKDSKYILVENKRLFSKNLYDAIGNIAKIRTTINPIKTSVSGLILRKKEIPHDELFIQFPENVFFRSDTILNYVFGNNDEIYIQLDVRSGQLDIKFENSEYDVDQIIFNEVNFELVPGVIGGNYIDRINLDMAWSEASIITDAIPPSIGSYDKYVKTIVISELLNLQKIEKDFGKNHVFRFDVNIKGIPHIPTDLNNLTWKMIYPRRFLTTTNTRDEVILVIDISTTDKLVFEISNIWYYSYFKNINRTSPLFLSIGQQQF